jgi:hypothetical protein
MLAHQWWLLLFFATMAVIYVVAAIVVCVVAFGRFQPGALPLRVRPRFFEISYFRRERFLDMVGSRVRSLSRAPSFRYFRRFCKLCFGGANF